MQLSADEATLMLAALACSSDGQCDQAEEDVIRDRLAPQLRRLGAAGEERTFTRLYGMMANKGTAWTLGTIGDALPGPKERLHAIRVAVEIVRADGSLTREEMDHLADVAKELGITKQQLQQAMNP